MTYSDEELLDALREFAAEYGRPPTAPEANGQEGFPTATTFINHFESWNAALTEAGLETRASPRRQSDDELLADLRELVDTLGKHPSRTTINEREDMATAATYRRRFGSLNEALASAGLPTFSRHSYSDDDLIGVLHRLADELGRSPRAADLDADSSAPNRSAYIARFGSWNRALAVAGLDTHGYSDEELLAILRELADDLGRPPQLRDLTSDETLPSATAFTDHFGTWSNAVSAALADESDEGASRASATADGGGKQADE